MIIQNVDLGRIFMLHNFLKIPWYDTQCTLQNQCFASTSVHINIIVTWLYTMCTSLSTLIDVREDQSHLHVIGIGAPLSIKPPR